MARDFEKTEIAQEFMRGANCGQMVLRAFADDLGYDEEETDRMAACFGGGMHLGKTCGAVCGAMVALGLSTEDGKEDIDKVKEFIARFGENHPGFTCSELLGEDMADPENALKVLESGKTIDVCPAIVKEIIGIVDELID